jgi:hypothetical protein
MPATMTFASLQDDLRAYLERGDTTDTTVFEQLPKLINLAERRLGREVKILGTIAVVSSTMIPGQSVYAKPDRWRETISVSIGTGNPANRRSTIAPRSYEFVRAVNPDPTVTGTPRFYADYNYSHWLFGPTPATAHPYEVVYHENPAYLDETSQTNYWTDYAPNALLYAALLEATPFLKNDPRIAVWEGFYNRAVAALNGEDERQIVDRTIVRREA